MDRLGLRIQISHIIGFLDRAKFVDFLLFLCNLCYVFRLELFGVERLRIDRGDAVLRDKKRRTLLVDLWSIADFEIQRQGLVVVYLGARFKEVLDGHAL